MDWRSRIEIDPNRLGGKPVVRGSRMPVVLIVEMAADGWDAGRIMESYPTLSADNIQACLQFAAAILREDK